MFNLFTRTEDAITSVVYQLAVNPLHILAAGVLAIALPLLVMWMLYRSYLIMAGLSTEPLMTTLKDFFVKGAIIVIAGSSIYLVNSFLVPLIDAQEGLANEIQSGNAEPILAKVESAIGQIASLIQAVFDNGVPSQSIVDELTQANGELPFYIWAMARVQDAWSGVADVFQNVMAVIGQLVRYVMVLIGLAVVGISAFTTIIINKVFFILSLGFAPLFIFFLAFDMTKGWFSSWLNTALGYGLAYPVVSLGVSVLLNIYDGILQRPTLTFLEATGCLVGGFLFAVLIGRLGDIASQWFGAGNISDGTAAVMAAVSKSLGRTAISPAKFGMRRWQRRRERQEQREELRKTMLQNKGD